MARASARVEALDVSRGLALAAMVLVNNPGDWNAAFPPLLHSYWTGLTFADLIFPAFIFIMGVATPFALARRNSRGESTARIYLHVILRAGVLIALGLALNALAAWPA